MQSMILKRSASQRLIADQAAPEPGVGMTVHEAMQKICANVINAGLIRRQLATGVFDLELIDSLLGQIMDSSYKASEILIDIYEVPAGRTRL